MAGRLLRVDNAEVVCICYMYNIVQQHSILDCTVYIYVYLVQVEMMSQYILCRRNFFPVVFYF